MKQKIVLLLEDDNLQAETIAKAVNGHLRGVTVEILATESDAYARFEEMAKAGTTPMLVISDVMMPWAEAGPVVPPPPPAVVKGTFRKAGTRSWGNFRGRNEFAKVPWIYFTVLDEDTIEYKKYTDEFTGFRQKDGPVGPLLEEIDAYLKMDDAWTESETKLSERLAASTTTKKSLIDGLRTPLTECIQYSHP